MRSSRINHFGDTDKRETYAFTIVRQEMKTKQLKAEVGYSAWKNKDKKSMKNAQQLHSGRSLSINYRS
jgi:hypothetical protein